MEVLEMNSEGWAEFFKNRPEPDFETQQRINKLKQDFETEKRLAAFKMSINQPVDEHVQKAVQLRQLIDSAYGSVMKKFAEKYPK